MDNFKKNQLVTWGSGTILALYVGQLEDRSSLSRVALAADYTSPCGHVWRAGKQLEMPNEELRAVEVN